MITGLVGLAAARPAGAESYDDCVQFYSWTVPRRTAVGARLARVDGSWVIGPEVSMGWFKEGGWSTGNCGEPHPFRSVAGRTRAMGISGVSGWMLFGESMGWMAGVDGYGGRMVGGPVMGDVQASAGLVASPGSLNISVATRAGITPVFHSIESDGSARLVYTPHVSYGLRVLLSSQETQEPMLFPEIAVGAAGSDVTYRASDW